MTPRFSKAKEPVIESEEINNHGVDHMKLDDGTGIHVFYWKVTERGLDISDAPPSDG